MNFLSQLKQRNALLYWFGLFNIAVGIICLILIQSDDAQILGVNRWLKPMKFYFSVGIMTMTMGWLLHYLNNSKKIKRFSWMIVFTMFFENGLILLQAVRKTTSHYNVSTSLNGIIFNLMGILIITFTVVVISICISFFRQKTFEIPDAYLWGIRLGLLFFILFSLEGGVMIGLLKHTVGGTDGSQGLPLVNWSTQYGDLRIAHFIGLHSLQVLPLFGNYISKSKTQTIIFSIAYFVIAAVLFVQALTGTPLFF